MDLYPAARRVLLTAYADTGAAIDAINVVDLDHYLLKPWDPPEEKLYPVVDALLEAWNSADHRPVPETKVVGHRWSARSSEVREFLARNQVPYRWYCCRRARGPAAARRGRGGRAARCRVVITADGDRAGRAHRRRAGRAGRPDDHAVEGLLRPRRHRRRPGRARAPRCTAPPRGCAPCCVERTATGGQAGQSSRIENYLGFPDGVSGAQLTDRARRQAVEVRRRDHHHPRRRRAGGQRLGPDRALRRRQRPSTRTPSSWPPACPTGSWRRRAVDELTGRGVFYGSALTEAANCADQDVYIVGGANSAGQAAVYLPRRAKSVTLLVRGAVAGGVDVATT